MLMIQYELMKFVVVGLTSNLVLFILYLALTEKTMGHLQAMTLVYMLGVAIGFLLNRCWTFSHKGHWSPAFLRYVFAYVLGYVLNLILLYVLVDRLGLPHRWVQLVLVLMVAAFLFMFMKFWVFRALRLTETRTKVDTGP